ncbi:uncharacterized protein LOC114309688 [Camellia sinensis]|uniref:uncharacterized protein LOC114309688 n=1 Tax=Camellia sinensis TaxID=4442 RepID=UPI00103578A0|nr:uncharacterized protein LOC114309688 [Camellia sinensis]
MGRFEENVCMSKEVFAALCETLINDFGLQVPQRPHGLAVEESVAMLMHVLKGKQNREIQERFQHSGETVSRHVHNVLTSMKEFTVVHCRPTYSQHRIHPYVRSRRKYLPFKDCIGAIDGTHVSAWVTGPDAATYFGRKYCHMQNIMAAVDFDMCFIFISCGWEGSMHDSRIFNEILTNDNVPFPHPDEGKYYLVDSGYANRIGYLAPFKGHRYHQQEFRRITRNAMANTPRELFNKVHSSLRSVVERTFGAWKNRWGFIRDMPRYDFANVQEEAMTIVTAIPEVEHDEDGLMVGDEDPHMALVRLHIRDKLCYMRNNGMLGNI